MKTKIALIALVSAFIFSSCGQSSSSEKEQTATPSAKVPNEALKVVLTGYFDVKNALVGDDAAQAQEAASKLSSASGKYADQLNPTLNKIAATTDIEEQRAAFETLSIDIYGIAKDGEAGVTIYKQFCPMAFDDKGAFWLSDKKEIRNPFFGASMLTCGSVKETIN